MLNFLLNFSVNKNSSYEKKKETTPPHENNCHTNVGYNGLRREPKSLECIRSQPDDNTYYTDGSSDGTRVAAKVIHTVESIIIRLNDSISLLDAEMTVIRLALEDASETRDTITIHTDSQTINNNNNNNCLKSNIQCT